MEKQNQPKIIDETIQLSKKMTHENIQNNEMLLVYNFKLLKDNIQLLKDSKVRIKEMIQFSKGNEEMDLFFKEHGQESSFDKHSYSVGDVEKEMQSIEEIKSQIKELHESITNTQFDSMKEQEYLQRLEEAEKEFVEIVTWINPEQQN